MLWVSVLSEAAGRCVPALNILLGVATTSNRFNVHHILFLIRTQHVRGKETDTDFFASL